LYGLFWYSIIIIINYHKTYNYCSLYQILNQKLNLISISIFSSLLVWHRLNRIWTHVLLLIIRNFFYCGEIFFSCVKMVNCDLIHCNIHDGAMSSMSILTRKVRLTYVRCTTAHVWINAKYPSWMLFLNFLGWLEYGRQQTLILHKWTIMMIFANCTYSTYNTGSNIVFKVTVKCLVFAVIYL